MLWLTTMEQQGLAEVTIKGRATTLIALSDFVSNLGNTTFFKKPVEIIESKAEQDGSGMELVQFTVKAELANAPATQQPARGAARR
jgi:Tfp pilus assembly protein PilN